MGQLLNLMESYFSTSEGKSSLLQEKVETTIPKSLPIEPTKKNTWKKLDGPERLSKIYKVTDRNKFNNIIMDILELQNETFHDGRITIQFPKIKLEIWTHDLMSITEVDLEWTRKIDQIFDGYMK